MYYSIYSTEKLYMKKLSVLFLLLAAGLPLGAQSTCEIRVDRNLDKTTMQKVHYCLFPEEEPEEPESQVIYFAAYDSRAPRPVEKPRIPMEIIQPEGAVYNGASLSKNREYWEAKHYPLFTNDIPSSEDEREVNCAVMELFPGSTFVPPPTATRIIMYRNGAEDAPLTVFYGGKEIALRDNGDGTFSIPGTEGEDGKPLTGYFAYDPTGAENKETVEYYQPSVNLSTTRGNPYFKSK